MSTYEIEEIILGMADIVHENRMLRYELEQTKKALRDREQHIERMHQSTLDGQKSLFEAGLKGAFCSKKEREQLNKLKEAV